MTSLGEGLHEKTAGIMVAWWSSPTNACATPLARTDPACPAQTRRVGNASPPSRPSSAHLLPISSLVRAPEWAPLPHVLQGWQARSRAGAGCSARSRVCRGLRRLRGRCAARASGGRRAGCGPHLFSESEARHRPARNRSFPSLGESAIATAAGSGTGTATD